MVARPQNMGLDFWGITAVKNQGKSYDLECLQMVPENRRFGTPKTRMDGAHSRKTLSRCHQKGMGKIWCGYRQEASPFHCTPKNSRPILPMNLIARNDLEFCRKAVRALMAEREARGVDCATCINLLSECVERLCNVIADIDRDVSKHSNERGE